VTTQATLVETRLLTSLQLVGRELNHFVKHPIVIFLRDASSADNKQTYKERVVNKNGTTAQGSGGSEHSDSSATKNICTHLFIQSSI
jgi:hypothetical protein